MHPSMLANPRVLLHFPQFSYNLRSTPHTLENRFSPHLYVRGRCYAYRAAHGGGSACMCVHPEDIWTCLRVAYQHGEDRRSPNLLFSSGHEESKRDLRMHRRLLPFHLPKPPPCIAQTDGSPAIWHGGPGGRPATELEGSDASEEQQTYTDTVGPIGRPGSHDAGYGAATEDN